MMSIRLKKATFLVALVSISLIIAAPFIIFDWMPLDVGENPWQNESLAESSDAGDATWTYHRERYYPSYVFIHHAGQADDSVLWNPYEYGGVPFMAAWYTRCFSLFTLPFYFLPLAVAWNFSVVLKFLIAGLTVAYVARKLGVTFLGAFLCAVLYQCSTIFLIHGGEPVSDCAPWFPLLFLFAERVAHGQYRYWPSGALALGLMLLGGDGVAVSVGLGFVSLYVVFRTISLRSVNNYFNVGFAFFSMVVVGVGLASIQLIPWWSFRGATSTVIQAAHYWPPLTQAGAMILPGLGDNGPSTSLHIGWVPLLTAMLYGGIRPTLFKPQQNQLDSIAALAVLPWILALILGVAFEGVHEHLAVSHIVYPAVFFAALLSTITLETWLSLNPEQCRSVLKRLLFYFPVLIVILVVSIGFTLYRRNIPASELSLQLVVMALSVFIYLVCLGKTLVKPSLSFLVILMCIVAFLNMAVLISMAPHGPAAAAVRNSSTIEMIQQAENRIGVSAHWNRWPLSVFQISQIEGVGGDALSSYAMYWERSQQDPQLYVQTAASLLLTKSDIQANYRDLRPDLSVKEISSGGAVLFNYIHPIDRVRMVDEVRSVDSFDPKMLSPFAPPLLEGNFPDVELPEFPVSPLIKDAEKHDRLTVQCEGSGPGLLMVADTWEEGWKAYIDGEEADILKVNGAFRGVFIGKDALEVRFQYEPNDVKTGKLGSGIALIVALFGFLNVFIHRFHSRNVRVSS